MKPKSDFERISKKNRENLVKLFRDIEQELNDLNEKRPDLSDQLEILTEGLNAVSLNFERVQEDTSKRQFLIDLQCAYEVFDGPVHEEYHLISSRLSPNFDSYISSIKTALNRLPPVIFKALPHKNRDGLKPRSFGTFLNSIKEHSSKEAELIKEIFISDGQRIEDTIHEYRDKNIEHVPGSTPGATLVSDVNGIRKLHRIKQPKTNAEDTESFLLMKARLNSLSKEKRGHAIKCVKENGEYVYVVHVESEEPLTGRMIPKGEILGFPSDGGSGHFDKYGPHGHNFMSPSISPDELITEGSLSPSSIESLIEISKFLKKVLTVLNRLPVPAAPANR